jgi:hypothetical protein
LFIAAALILSAPPLLAQAAPATATPAAEPYSTDTELGILIADPAARAVVDKYAPGLSKTPQMGTTRFWPLKAFQSFAPAMLTDKVLSDIDDELANLTPLPRTAQSNEWRPINVNEAKVTPYTLPDPLLLLNGTPVHDAKTWWKKRRPEIYAMFETQQYGRAPGRPASETFEVFDKGTPALDGKAIRKQVIIHLSEDPAAPRISLVEYIPAAASKPVPMFLMIGFTAPFNMFDDSGIREGTVWNPQTKQKMPASQARGMGMGKVNIIPFLATGIGVATFYYGDVDPDFSDGYALGVRALYDKGDDSTRAPDAWGSISAWAWAMSRVQDYFETDRTVDARRVAINGASRLGKTVLWAAARDQRFAAVVACCSGEGGAALSHRNFGQTIAELLEEAPYQFARNYRKYADKEQALPMDAHMLLSLIAPRPVLLQTGKHDLWSDPKGEFEAAVAAGPVYRLLGKQDLGTTTWPPSEPILNDLAYLMDNGGHGMEAGDWDIYLAFLKKYLHP